ncbi:MAG TPA: hypothetical protein VGE50_09800 [Gammaproteobacteria bacterium]
MTGTFRVWGVCIDCNFEGPIEYTHIEGENYEDGEALGVMLLQRCPACESVENALIPLDYYQQMLEERVVEEPGDQA